MHTLDATYESEYGHKAGVTLEFFGTDREVFLTAWDWDTLVGPIDTLAIIRKKDIPKIIEFLENVTAKGD